MLPTVSPQVSGYTWYPLNRVDVIAEELEVKYLNNLELFYA